MIGNRRPSEVLAASAQLAPVAMVNVEKLSGTIDMRAYEQAIFFLQLGDMAAETIDFKLQQCTAADGTGAKDLVVATQLAAHATNNDGGIIILECRAEEVDLTGGFYFVRGRGITGGAAGGLAAILGLGFNHRFNVGTDLATVKEIKQA